MTIPIDAQYKVTAEAMSRFVDKLSLEESEAEKTKRTTQEEEASASVERVGGHEANRGNRTIGSGSSSRNQRGEGAGRCCPLKGIILSSPSNPTGAMLSAEEIEEIVKVG